MRLEPDAPAGQRLGVGLEHADGDPAPPGRPRAGDDPVLPPDRGGHDQRGPPPPRRPATFRHWTGQLGSHRHRTRFMTQFHLRRRLAGPGLPACHPHPQPPVRPVARTRRSPSTSIRVAAQVAGPGVRRADQKSEPAAGLGRQLQPPGDPVVDPLQPAEGDGHAGGPQGLLPGPQPAGRVVGPDDDGSVERHPEPGRPDRVEVPRRRGRPAAGVADQVRRHGQRQCLCPAAVRGPAPLDERPGPQSAAGEQPVEGREAGGQAGVERAAVPHPLDAADAVAKFLENGRGEAGRA